MVGPRGKTSLLLQDCIEQTKLITFYFCMVWWFRYLNEISISRRNFDFSTKFRFLNEISISQTKFRFLDEISISRRNFDFSTKFRFLNEISIPLQNFDFSAKFWFFDEISTWQKTLHNLQIKSPFNKGIFQIKLIFCWCLKSTATCTLTSLKVAIL